MLLHPPFGTDIPQNSNNTIDVYATLMVSDGSHRVRSEVFCHASGQRLDVNMRNDYITFEIIFDSVKNTRCYEE